MSDAGLSGEDAELVRQLRDNDENEPWCGPFGMFCRAAARIEALSAELATLRAALAEAKAKVEWRPIESAPHAADVLLWCGPGEPLEVGQASWGWRNEVASNMTFHGRAKMWLPLPHAPEAER
jgi:hypothetical protein